MLRNIYRALSVGLMHARIEYRRLRWIERRRDCLDDCPF